MWYQIPTWPLVLVPILFITSKCHTPKNNSDVIVTYSGHSEAERENITRRKNEENITTTEGTTTFSDFLYLLPEDEMTSVENVTEEPLPKVTTSEDVVFIPNVENREVIRNEEYLLRNPMKLKDLMGQNDGEADEDKLRMETEAPNDIIFVNGKNNGFDDVTEAKKETGDGVKPSVKKTKEPKLNCTNLDCENNVKSLCAGKIDHKKWRYRLFMNECYFRKVNCNFKKKENRYKQVSLDNCKNVGVHSTATPYMYRNIQQYFKDEKPKPRTQDEKVNNSRKVNVISRRSLTMGIDGLLCDHLCPVSCPEDYDPECGLSARGRRRVFINHCSMDLDSCLFNAVWRRRPLAECVGGKKADMRQNRGFINWMQSVGIVDNKGRLVLN